MKAIGGKLSDVSEYGFDSSFDLVGATVVSKIDISDVALFRQLQQSIGVEKINQTMM
jgi:hypothetical protein